LSQAIWILWSLDMPAYLIVEHTITDPAKFQEYGDKVRPLVAKYAVDPWREAAIGF
jgi:hypothetical protein